VADLTAKAAKELEHTDVVCKCYKAGEKLIEDLKYRLNYSNDDDKSFVEHFFIWKEKIRITSEQYEKYITWLHSEVDKRTDAVVGGGFRGRY